MGKSVAAAFNAGGQTIHHLKDLGIKLPKFIYRAAAHKGLPHIIKFSGGRSSGMMLFTLLEVGLLNARRGDVIIFNNTSAEHPDTYRFVKQCKQVAEDKYGIPFFWIEHCTYEDACKKGYTRSKTFRLVNPDPFSPSNPDGYRWKGEVFEEVLSWDGFVPSVFQRTCTVGLKLDVTRNFLKEWFKNSPQSIRRGHYAEKSRIDPDELHHRHAKNGGKVPRDIFLQKKDCVLSQPHFREAQMWSDFSGAYQAFDNPIIDSNNIGGKVNFGEGCLEYLSLIGIRSDEESRVRRITMRSGNDDDYEHVYMPLSEFKMTKEEVLRFWNQQSWDLCLKDDDNLSNCTYCFLKGAHTLRKIKSNLDNALTDELRGTPCDLNWWVSIEEKYGRDLKAEKRIVSADIPDDMIGFFGAKSGTFYRTLLSEGSLDKLDSDYPSGPLPCDCTD